MSGAGAVAGFRRSIAAATAACLVLGSPALIGGCSFIFVRGPKKEAPGRYDPAGCTTSRFVPAVDAILTSAQGAATIIALDRTDADYRNAGLSRDANIEIGVTMTLLFAISAMYGFAAVGTCRVERGHAVSPYQSAPATQSRSERHDDEAAEEAAVQARLKAKAAADAKASGEAAARAPANPAAPARGPGNP